MRRTILTIDDEPIIGTALAAMFGGQGYRVVQARSGPEGIELARKGGIDLILLDLEMPGMDGREVVRFLKSAPETRHVPVIIFTSSEGQAETIQSLDAAADEYVTKSVSRQELAARVRAMLRLKELQDQLVSLEREKHEAKLAFARDIQRRLLPASLPAVPGLNVQVSYEPCDPIGGDFYDFILGAPGRLYLILGDAEGHGVGAALLMATARAYMRASLGTDSLSPSGILRNVNKLFCADAGMSGFLPMACLRFDVANRTLSYSNAGHETPVLLRRNSRTIDLLDATSPILGVNVRDEFAEEQVALEPGDMVLCFTDGLTRACGPSGATMDQKEVVEIAFNHMAEGISEVRKNMVRTWKRLVGGDADDDMTLVVVELRDVTS